MTSRWLCEVATVRNVDITWNVMSLYFLNKDRPTISTEYLNNAQMALGPLRIISQAEKVYGPTIKGDLYTAFGEEIHLNQPPLRNGWGLIDESSVTRIFLVGFAKVSTANWSI